MVSVWSLIYFMLPAYFANMAPVLSRGWLKFLAVPIDGGITFKGKRLFGANKTWRGFLMAIVYAIVVAFLQSLLYQNSGVQAYSLVAYDLVWLPLGFLMGLGSISGDLVESFVKRRFSIGPGRRFFPWDQIDFVLGALLLSSILYVPSAWEFVLILVLSVMGHILCNHIGFYVGIKDDKW